MDGNLGQGLQKKCPRHTPFAWRSHVHTCLLRLLLKDLPRKNRAVFRFLLVDFCLVLHRVAALVFRQNSSETCSLLCRRVVNTAVELFFCFWMVLVPAKRDAALSHPGREPFFPRNLSQV